MKKLIIMAFAAAALTALTAMSVSAASPITISDAEINASSTAGESVVDFACQSTQDTEQFSMILTSEELSETIAFDKIVHIDQVDVSDDGTYTFSVLDARIPDGASKLYLRVGGMGIDEPCDYVINLLSAILGDCDGNGEVNTEDIVLLRKYIAGLTSEIAEDNANVDTTSAEIDTNDLMMLRKAVAGLIELE